MAIKFLSGLNLSNVTAGSILKLDSNGNIVAAVDGTDYNTSSSLWSTAGTGGVNINKDVRIGTFSSDVLPEARLHVYEYQTTDPKILIEDGNTGDASMQFKISTQSYTMGIDNSDSDKFIIANTSGFGLAANTHALEISTNGKVTIPAFSTQGSVRFEVASYNRLRVHGVDLLGYNGDHLWVIGNNTTNTINLGSSWDWDAQVAISYTPGTTGQYNGVLSFGQTEKNNTDWTHGVTRFYTSGAERVRFDSAGNVGIGSTAPAAKLNVASTGANAYSSTITKGTNMKGIINALSNNADDMVGIYFGTGTTSEGTHWSGITGSRSQSTTDWSTQLNFYTHNEDLANINDATQKMVIKGNGNVGIGTTSPTRKLSVEGTAYLKDDLAVTATNPGTNLRKDSQIYLQSKGNQADTIRSSQWYLQTESDSIYGNSGFSVSKNYDGGSSVEYLRIDSAGKVGIGTDNPAQKLHVVGDIYTTSDFRGNSIISTNAALTISNTGIQPDQGSVEDIVAFNFATTKVSHIDTDGYIHAVGFKTNTSATGFLKADGTVDTDDFFSGAYNDLSGKPTLGTMAAAATSDYKTSDQTETYVATELASYTLTSALGTSATTAASAYATAAQGTTADAALPKAGGTMSGTMKVTGSIIHEFSSAGGYVPFPKGAMYTTATNAHTGAVRIQIPVGGVYDMVKFVVEIFDYTSSESVTLNISGYINGGSNQWVNQTVVTLADSTAKDYKVRFGKSDDKATLYIGETDSTWSYPQIIVRDFYCGFNGDVDRYDDGWNIDFATSFENVEETYSDNLPAADWSRLKSKPSTFAPTIGTTATTAMAGNTSLFDGAYGSLSGLPTLGTAAATASTAYATSAQGTTADAALPKAGGTMTGVLKLDSELQFLRGETEYSNYIRAANYPSQNYTSSAGKYWLEYGAKGGHHFVLNTDGGAGSDENAYDDFTIWNGAVDGDRLLEVTNAGNVTTAGKLYIGTTSATTTATTALFLGAAGEVKKRGLGSNAFNSTSFLPLAGGTITGQVIFPSAATTKPVLPNGYIARNDNSDTDGTHDIWGISERYYPSNETDGDAWGIQWSGTPNEINFIGAGQKKLSIDLDTAGTVKIDGNAVATESYVGTQISNLVDSSPAALNTLNELAAALGDDASFSTTMSTALGNRLRIDVNNQSLSSTELANARTNLGLGTAATSASTAFVAVGGDTMTGALTISAAANAAWLASITNTSASGHGLIIQAGGTTGTRYITQWKDAAGTERFHMDDTGEAYFQNTITASGGINGLTLANGGISGGNYNITGVNQLEFNDPGEGIVFKSGSSGDMTLAIVDDASDNTLKFSGSGARFEVAGSIKHTGLELTSGTSVDQISEFGMSFRLVADTWTDTGIDGTDLSTGTYAMQVYVSDFAVGGQHYYEYYSATISWYDGGTNSTAVDEIPVHRAGHAPNNGDIQFRTQRASGTDSHDLMLQVKTNSGYTENLDNDNGGKIMRFKFRRLM